MLLLLPHQTWCRTINIITNEAVIQPKGLVPAPQLLGSQEGRLEGPGEGSLGTAGCWSHLQASSLTQRAPGMGGGVAAVKAGLRSEAGLNLESSAWNPLCGLGLAQQGPGF